MGKKSQKVGSEWETLVERMFRRCPGCEFVVNWNDKATTRARKGGKKQQQDRKPADIQATVNGLSVLVECKTTNSTSLPLNVINDKRWYEENIDGKDPSKMNNQRKTLYKHAASDGLSLIAIRQRFPNKSRYFLCSYQHWEVIRKRLSPHRKSIPLNDKERPTELLELGRSFFSEVSAKNKKDVVVKNVLDSLYETALATPLINYRRI